MSEHIHAIEPKSKWGWVLYDWANSAFATTVIAGFFPVFFKSYYSAGTDPTVSTAQLGLANSIGTLCVALTGPIFGAVADSGSYKKKFLVLFAYLGVLMTLALSLVEQGQWALASVIYVIGNVGFAGSIGFYDSLLPLISDEKDIDYMSALGYSMGYLGGGVLFATNVVMYQKPEWFGIADGVTAIRLSFVTVGIWWGLFTIPLMLWVKEPKTRAQRNFSQNLSNGLKELKGTIAQLKRLKTVMFFLGAFFLYNDAVGTTIKMAVDYGLSIGFDPSSLIGALLLTQFVGFPAALLFGKLSHLYHPKKGIYACIAMYIIVIIWASQMKSPWEFYVLAGFIGLVQGGIQALSRSYYSRLIPKQKSGEFYGFYNMLGKFAGLIGPLLIGAVSVATGEPRYGILSVALIFIAGGLLFTKVDEARGQQELKSFE